MPTRRFNCLCVGVSEVVGVSSTVSFDFVSHVYRENYQDECLSKIPVTGIHADKISEKVKNGGVLERGDRGNFRSRENGFVSARPSYSSQGTGRHGHR